MNDELIKAKLIELKEFFDNTPEKWIKASYANDSDGQFCDIEDATCFCLLGGIRKITGNYYSDIEILNQAIAYKLNDQVALLFPARYSRLYLNLFNDHPDTTFEDIKLVLERACEA